MKSFTQKWQQCARYTGPDPDPEPSAPLGFASTVVSMHLQSQPDSWERAWLRFSLPALTASAMLLLIAAVIYLRSPSLSSSGLRPPLENTIIEQIHLL